MNAEQIAHKYGHEIGVIAMQENIFGGDKMGVFPLADIAELCRAVLDAAEYRKKYEELLYAVAKRWPRESRHQTALRYILQAESGDGVQVEAVQLKETDNG